MNRRSFLSLIILSVFAKKTVEQTGYIAYDYGDGRIKFVPDRRGQFRVYKFIGRSGNYNMWECGL